MLSNSQWNKIWSLNGFSIQYTHQYCNGQMMLSTIHKCTCECLQLPFPSPLWMCILYDEMSAGIICVSGDGCQPSHPCNYPTPPHPHSPLPQSVTVMSSRVPHITDMLSVFELVLYRVEDQRSIFMQCDYLEYLILI